MCAGREGGTQPASTSTGRGAAGSLPVNARTAVGTCSSSRVNVSRTAASSSGRQPTPASRSNPSGAAACMAITAQLCRQVSRATSVASFSAVALPSTARHRSPPVAASSKAARAVPNSARSFAAVLGPMPGTPGRLSEASPRSAA